MFTLYAVARYMDSDGWINKKDLRGLSEIFKLANITLTSDKKTEECFMSYIKIVIFILVNK